MKKLPVLSIVAAALLIFVLFNGISSAAFKNWRLDLTEQGLYGLSEGTENILQGMQTEVRIDLYFSTSASRDLAALRGYAQRVEELIQEYALISEGKLVVNKIDPEPFSEQEDEAAAAGLSALPINNGLETLYFGIVASSEYGEQVIPFLQPDREAYLEYELSQLIYNLQRNTLPVVGVISSLDVQGGFDYRSGQQTAPWMSFDQLQQLYEIRSLTTDIEAIDDDVDLLVLVQPKGLSESALRAIDRFALAGGRVLLFVDPLAEQDSQGPMGMEEGSDPDVIQPLLKAWGVDFDSHKVVLDADYALVVNQGPGRPPVRHIALAGLDPTAMAEDDIALMDLEMVNLASAGALQASEGASTNFEPLLRGGANSMLVDVNKLRLVKDPVALARDFQADDSAYVYAARISGPAKSAFPVDEELADNDLQEGENLAITIVADTDVLSDRLWVQVQNFFGQRIASPWADNGNLFINWVDHLVGSADLISIRARGSYSRPFERVAELQQDAEERFRDHERELQMQLEATEAELNNLQSQQAGEDGLVTLTPEQEQALQAFQQQKIAIRKQLRDVQHELNKEIEALGEQMKWLNITFIPILLTLWVLLSAWRRKQS
jgi:ABC-type uncharacterized transport system involved in gliding motility auxiliary subunit